MWDSHYDYGPRKSSNKTMVEAIEAIGTDANVLFLCYQKLTSI